MCCLSFLFPSPVSLSTFSFGINYRKRKIYNKKLIRDNVLEQKVHDEIFQYSMHNLGKNNPAIADNRELARLLLKDNMSPLTANNAVKVLVNGEQKFPEVLKALEQAKHHIHIEYYIYEDDEIGRTIEELLIRKAKEGVTVRFIYDDFGSRTIRKKMVRRMREAGVKALYSTRSFSSSWPTGSTTATTARSLWWMG